MVKKVVDILYCRNEYIGTEVGRKSTECEETRTRIQWESVGWIITSIPTQKSKWTIISEKNK